MRGRGLGRATMSDSVASALQAFEVFCGDSEDVCCLYDLDLRYVAINGTGLAALGLGGKEVVLGKTNSELLGADGAAMEGKLRCVLETGEAVRFAHPVAGEQYETLYSAVRSAAGASVLLAARCSRTKEALREARAKAKTLARERTRNLSLIRMLESNPSVLTWVLDPRGDVVEYVSAPACRSILGVEPEALVGRSHLAHVHPDDAEAVRAALQSRFAPPRRLTYRRRLANGSFVTVALAPGAWHRDESGRLFVQESSVSHLLKEESIEFKQMYITRTAHDLKTPITSFRLALDQLGRLLETRNPVDDLGLERAALVEQARHATEFMDIIVRQAVDVGKLQAGQKISPTRGTVDLDSLLNKCTWLLAGYPKACDVSLRAGTGCEIPNFKGSYPGRFPLISADFWKSDPLSERSRSVNVCSGPRARGTPTLKRR